jgi:hypothetical protein
MKKAQFDLHEAVSGASYPPPHDEPCRGRKTWPLTKLYGLTQGGRSYVCDEYSIADIASWTWVDQYNDHVGGLAELPNIAAWHARIAERPAVKRGMTVWLPESDGGWSAAGSAAQIAEGARNLRRP